MASHIIGFGDTALDSRAMRRPLRVAARLAWRILVHEKGRSALALVGVFIAILLVFIQLGFFIAVPQGGMLVYDNMRFDLLLVSTNYQFQAQPWQFPHARLTDAAKIAGVAQATPIYFGGGAWQDPSGGTRLDVFLIGFDPAARPFAVEDIERQSDILGKVDTILVDDMTRSIFGPLTVGRRVDIDDRRVTIGGTYHLGTGFLGIGVVLLDEANFFRVTHRRQDPVNLGLITLAPGADKDKVAAELRQQLGDDVQLFDRAELTAHENAYWTSRTSVGLIFGSGLVVSLIVGLMVLYQTLATQIARHLPEFATLKAIGYRDASLAMVVTVESLILAIAAFIPAAVAAMAVYALIRSETLLPLALSPTNVALVLAAVLTISVGSACLSLSALRRADPAEIF
ncbi:MAG TPA: FtsX-like permease family protein [Stellaceae bacterium]|jgi:putative ABC transport system permease protein|nr:FtsX-like permease family protein [Stellaceae bacterium]